MNNPFNALNYKPREQTYGQQFLYDGTHTIEDLEKLGKQLKSEKNWNQNIFDKLSKAVTK